MKKVRIGLVSLTLILGGCATGAQLEGRRMGDVATDTSQEHIMCEKQVFQRPEFASVTTKLPPPGPHSASMSILANDQKPSVTESQTLVAFYDAMQPCRIAALEGYGKIHPAVVAVAADSYRKDDENALLLIKREESWGQYAKARAANLTEMQSKYAVVVQQINSDLATENAYELQQRQAAGNALLAWSAYQQQIQAQQNIANALNRPRYTQCRYVGAFLQCNTM